MTVPVVGLTGGIASGKSTVARAFVAHGIPVVDADQLAREVVAVGSAGLVAIVESFGDQVLQADGSLDRKKLGALIFADPSLRQKLNAITHPLVAQLSAQRIGELQNQDVPYMIYEAPLIVENGLHRTMRALVVVALDVPRQIRRIMQRDNLADDEAASRIRAQLPLETKLAAADYVIDNGGSLAELTAQVDAVHAQLLARFAGAVP